jgi:hypothetical protein
MTVLGVPGGTLAFGLLGIVIGPVLLSIDYTLLNGWAVTASTHRMDEV